MLFIYIKNCLQELFKVFMKLLFGMKNADLIDLKENRLTLFYVIKLFS